MDVDSDVPITGLPELSAHLDALQEDPSLPLNAKLFDEVLLQLNQSNIPPLIPRWLPQITEILRSYTQDPALLVELSLKLLGPVTFTQCLALASQDSLLEALASPAPSANILAMAILHKAAADGPGTVAALSAMPALVRALVERWLSAPQVEVGEKGTRVLGDLLDVDCERGPTANGDPVVNGDSGRHTALVVRRRQPGHGRLWARLLRDEDVYDLLVGLVSGDEGGLSARQVSLAQGRLLGLLPRLAALDFAKLVAAEVEGSPPLLPFAALRMVDKDDVLMHLQLIDFFEALVSVMRVSEGQQRDVLATRAGVRRLLREAAREDAQLREAIATLPDRTVEEEAEPLRAWLREVMSGEEVRVAVR
jgi:hypothetical protein